MITDRIGLHSVLLPVLIRHGEREFACRVLGYHIESGVSERKVCYRDRLIAGSLQIIEDRGLI